MTRFQPPGSDGLTMAYQPRYDHWIGGEYVRPQRGGYFENATPVTGQPFTEVARGTAEDVDRALDAAHGAASGWARTPAADRAVILNRVADRMQTHLEDLAVAETWENGKAIRETLAADIPLAADHFRYSAAAVLAQEGGVSEVGGGLVAYRLHEPLGVVGQLVGWSFPILAAARRLAPALAAGNAVVLKPAEQTPASLHYWMSLVADLLPPGVVNIVNGLGAEAGAALAASPRVAAVTPPGEPGFGGASLFFADVSARDDDLYDAAVAGFTAFAPNQGSLSRALIEQAHYRSFLADAVERTERIAPGHPLDTGTLVGAQVSRAQLDGILSYLEVGVREGARVLTGGDRAELDGELAGGWYVRPTILEGGNHLRVFQEDMFGPVVSVTSFADFPDAIKIANDSRYGLGAGIWTRDLSTAYRAGRALRAGRVWTNCHPRTDLGNDRAELDRYQRTRKLIMSYLPGRL
jgi:aldehyde dehydrogenase